MSTRRRQPTRTVTKVILPEENATKKFLVGLAQQMVPLVIIAAIGVASTAHNTAEQVGDLRKSVSEQVSEMRKQMDRSDDDRKQALTQFASQAKDLAGLTASMNIYLQNQDTVNKEIRERLTFIERNQRDSRGYNNNNSNSADKTR